MNRFAAVFLVGALFAPGCHRDGDGASASADAKQEGEKPGREASDKAKDHDRVKLSKEAIEDNHVKEEPVTRHVLVPRFVAAVGRVPERAPA